MICLVTQNVISRLFKRHTEANDIILVFFVEKWKAQNPRPVVSWITSGPVSVMLKQICYQESGSHQWHLFIAVQVLKLEIEQVLYRHLKNILLKHLGWQTICTFSEYMESDIYKNLDSGYSFYHEAIFGKLKTRGIQYFSQYNWVLKTGLSSTGWIHGLKFSVGLSFILPLKNKESNKKQKNPNPVIPSLLYIWIMF